MKKLFWLLFLMPFISRSQTLELGFNYGNLIEPSASIKILKHIKIGAAYERYRDIGLFDLEHYYNLTKFSSKFLFIEYSKSFYENEFYAGICYGSFNENVANYQSTPLYGYKLGYSHDFFHGLCLNLEFGYEDSAPDHTGGFFSDKLAFETVTASIGIHYKIGPRNRKPHKK